MDLRAGAVGRASKRFPKQYHSIDLGAGFLEHAVGQARKSPGKKFLAVESGLENFHHALELDPTLASKFPLNLHVANQGALGVLQALARAGVKTSQISIRMPDTIALHLRKLLPACRAVLKRNGKVLLTTDVGNCEENYPAYAQASGLGYRYKGILHKPQTHDEKLWAEWNPEKPIYAHEFVRPRKPSATIWKKKKKIYHVVDVGAGMLERIGAQALLHPGKEYLAIDSDPMQVQAGLSSQPRLRKLPNLTIREVDYRKAFEEMKAAGAQARHITLHVPGFPLVYDIGEFLSECKKVLVPNGKVHWTDEAVKFQVKNIAEVNGFKYRFRGELRFPQTNNELMLQPVFQHEFTLGLKKVFPKKWQRRALQGRK